MPTALIVVDAQQGFHDPYWGRRDNPAGEEHIAALITAWRRHGEPIVFVRHDSVHPDSPLHPSSPGNAFLEVVHGEPDLLVVKSVNSCFYGEPDLDAWLRARGVDRVAICGFTTNHCCETTARMAGNLGYEVQFVLDATVTYDRRDLDGAIIPAETIRRVSAASLQDEFADVVDTATLVGARGAR
ncbi:cysteine hydrolase family protein [Egicoccus sp. AB-alg2]|uniref:cysteine hydrolase family protein n=1 Tax=Egicoccus sp. AB-alg2 TaxID=3242693 RepID=UPI00359D5054